MSDDPIETLIRSAGKRPGVDPARAERIRGAVHAEWEAVTTRRAKRRVFTALAVAASLGAFVLFVNWPRRVDPIVTTAGGSQTLAWGGGTLRIEENTRVTLQSRNVAVLEHGTVYFASETGGSGIVIHTPYGAARDIGTRFEVRVANEQARVRVDEGRVEMRGVIADAGMTIVATVGEATALLSLEGATLEDVLQRMAQQRRLSIEWYVSPELRRSRLRGAEPLPLEDAASAAALAAGVNVRQENGRLIVESAR